MTDFADRSIYGADHRQFRDTVRRVFARELEPHLDRHDREGKVERAFWRACGEAGLLCPGVPEADGGLGLDYGFNAIVMEELGYRGSHVGFQIHSDIVPGYLEAYGSDAQKRRYLPRMVSGQCITAIAMTEPGAGSDLQGIRTVARRDGDGFVLDGSKTYITNGGSADLVVVVAKTDPALGAKGISLFLVDADTPGFARGRKLDKVGQNSNDTSELFFNAMRVPAAALLGHQGAGFGYLMSQLPQERLSIAIFAQAMAQRAFDEAAAFTRQRQAFGKTILDFQNTRFELATMKTELQIGWGHLDWALARHIAGELTPVEAAAAKLWHTEMQGRVTDAALQLHGGAGYMNEYPIARFWRDARVTRIYGGSNEIMKEVIGRTV